MEAPALGYVVSPGAQFLSPPWTRAQGINWCYIPRELPCFHEGLHTTSGAGDPTPPPCLELPTCHLWWTCQRMGAV